MNAKEQLNKVRTLLGLEIKLEQMKLDNGTVLEAESFETGKEVFVLAEGDKIPVPAGEYSLEDGKVLVVAEDGIIGEVKEMADEPKEEVVEEQDLEEEAEAPAEVAAPKKVVESISKELHFEAIEEKDKEIEALKAKITELSEAKEDVEKENVELSKVEVFKHNPEATPKAKATNKVGLSKIQKIYNKLNK